LRSVVIFSLALLLLVIRIVGGTGTSGSGGRYRRETSFTDELFGPGIERFARFRVRVLGDLVRVGFDGLGTGSVELSLLFDVDSPASTEFNQLQDREGSGGCERVLT